MKRLFHFLLVLTALSFSVQVYGQRIISGHVKDRLSGEPLTGANIVLDGTLSGTISGIDGFFEINIYSEKEIIRVSYVGYETREIEVNTGGEYVIELDRDQLTFGDEVVVVGNRVSNRTVTSSPVPVDQFSSAVLENTGKIDLSQQLHDIAPSFYSTRLTYSDATDHMDPATLRGMNPDQTLILVNGKRHHPSAVVNVLSVVGKGPVINDLNTIPSSAIERVEILRDGASAQYGSDAIAGVINIVLRKDTGKVRMNSRVGQYYAGDGLRSYFSTNFGKGFKNGGLINVTVQLGNRENTNRAGTYSGLIYRTADQDGLTFEENLELDNQTLSDRGLSREDFKLQLGNSALTNANLFFNASIPMLDRSEFYAFGGLNYRYSESAGDYRLPNQPERNNINLYPDGFLPEISAGLGDQFLSAGFKSWITDWQVDFSNTYGSNHINFFVTNSVNASMGDDSQLEFESGGIRFTQNTTNLDFSHSIPNPGFFNSIDLLIGSEFRYENYRILAGEESSWINENQVSFPGAQGFPGYQPNDETDRSRTNTAVYTDIGFSFPGELFLEIAGRYEQYSDFGDNLSGKAAVRYAPFEWISLRSSVSTGFRAPALHQKYYSNTGSYYFSGFLFEILTAPNNSRVANAFGIPELMEETSLNLNAGVTAKIGNNSSLSVDIYQIDVNDRIVLSSTMFRFVPAVDQLLSDLPDVGGVQFFTNAVDTRTRGLDLVYTESVSFPASRLAFSLGVNLNKTEVIGDIKVSDEIEENELTSLVFDRQARALLELAQPTSKYSFTFNYLRDRIGVSLGFIRFGGIAYRGLDESEGRDQDYDPRWLTNLRINYQFIETLSLYIGANNLLDVYPERNNETLQDFGRFPYNTAVSQFGFNGGFYYAGLELSF